MATSSTVGRGDAIESVSTASAQLPQSCPLSPPRVLVEHCAEAGAGFSAFHLHFPALTP